MAFLPAVLVGLGAAAHGQGLPKPSGAPLTIDFAADPVLALARGEAPRGDFREAVAAAVTRNPSTAEFAATEDEAQAALRQVNEQRQPSVDLTLSTYRVIARDFSNDPQNIVERSRATNRTDAIAVVQQTLFDFGAGGNRALAAGARLRATGADLENAADRVALGAIASWYELFGYRALVELSEAFLVGLAGLRGAVEIRIRAGASAEGDLAQIHSAIARSQSRLAQFRRQYASAAARFAALTGVPAPAAIERAPVPPLPFADAAAASAAAAESAAVRSAEASATAARREARAARADMLPQLTGGLEAGRYGVFETERDYDIRGRLTLRQRLFGGAGPRADQFDARARSSDAAAARIRADAERDAAIAWSDVQALEEQLRALEAAYIAGRRARDVLVARFQATRGTLFDVSAAESAYFDSATAYIQGLTELDAARYVLLSRTGRLLPTLAIIPADLRNGR